MAFYFLSLADHVKVDERLVSCKEVKTHVYCFWEQIAQDVRLDLGHSLLVFAHLFAWVGEGKSEQH